MVTPPQSPKLTVNRYISGKWCTNVCFLLGILALLIIALIVVQSKSVTPYDEAERSTDRVEDSFSMSNTDVVALNRGGIPDTKSKWSWSALGGLKQETIKCRKDAFLLILITSSPENFVKRQGIRKSYCNKKQTEAIGGVTCNWQCVFLIGKTDKYTINKNLKKESAISRDLLFGNYLDSYRNLTLKVLHGLRWSSEECHAKYILKTDDDCFINTPILSQFLLYENTLTKGLYAGHVFVEQQHREVVRGNPKFNKWAVSDQDFKEQYYPEYVSGTGYVLSCDVVEDILSLVPKVPPFVNEDAYIGTLVHKLGISPVKSGRFSLQNKWKTCNFLYFFSIHGVGIETQAEMLGQVARARKTCHSGEEVKSWR
ncbi:beta-1,3-galactosyltransferase 1-like [Lingula anatina]|uniref:Hexosyltransferase n=1 Tax=Lingula anatina TaxID=7574 RepID=A0A1S3KHF1_LINAN|nr:beta-1,3-galactosyltransferase 1-like [Lingula anatina]|eukprot:XP_013422058.1 beta-1,3-galactosyltransferase 1-like [Lingula anatina]